MAQDIKTIHTFLEILTLAARSDVSWPIAQLRSAFGWAKAAEQTYLILHEQQSAGFIQVELSYVEHSQK